MRGERVLTLLAVTGFAVSLLPAHARAEFIGVAPDARVLRIDEGTGQGLEIGSTGQYAIPNALALDAAGTFYSNGWGLASEQRHLITIDPVTFLARGGPIVSLSIRGLAFSPSGTLFAIGDRGVAPDRLYTIDVNTGASTLIGSTELPGIQALDFRADGTLYGWDVGDSSGNGGLGLVTIDTVTGLATDVDPQVNAPSGRPLVQTVAFAPDGTLYAACESLFRVNIDTGALTLVGSGGYSDVRGMVWIPEPSALTILLTMAPIALLAYAWRRKRKPAT